MSESILVAGPWVGEFGYELFRWQAQLRALAPQYDQVYVASRPGHALLYRDFANFIPFDSDPNPCADRFNGSETDIMPRVEKAFGHIPYTSFRSAADKFHDKDPCSYVKLGEPFPAMPPYELIFHARNINVNTGQMRPRLAEDKIRRNWDYDKWVELTTFFQEYGYEMASIGDPRAAHHLPGTQDRRGLPLDDLAAMLRAGGWIIGPSSGPMHFATLCGCPQLVWGAPPLERRYKETWNPFKTFVEFLPVDKSWNPSVDSVKQAFIRLHE